MKRETNLVDKAEEDVRWSRKHTVNPEASSKVDLHHEMLEKSIAVVGETPEGFRALAVQFPHIQSSDLDTRKKVQELADKFYQRYLAWAVKQGHLMPEEALYCNLFCGPNANLSRLPRQGRKDNPESDGQLIRSSSEITIQSPHQIVYQRQINVVPQRVESKFNISKKKLIVVGGVTLLSSTLAACVGAEAITKTPEKDTSDTLSVDEAEKALDPWESKEIDFFEKKIKSEDGVNVVKDSNGNVELHYVLGPDGKRVDKSTFFARGEGSFGVVGDGQTKKNYEFLIDQQGAAKMISFDADYTNQLRLEGKIGKDSGVFRLEKLEKDEAGNRFVAETGDYLIRQTVDGNAKVILMDIQDGTAQELVLDNEKATEEAAPTPTASGGFIAVLDQLKKDASVQVVKAAPLEPSPTPTMLVTEAPAEILPTAIQTEAPTPTEDLNLAPWDERNMEWESDVIEGTYKGVKVKIQLNIAENLFEREGFPVCGIEENEGNYKQIADAAAAAVSMLPKASGGRRIIEVNTDLLSKANENNAWWLPEKFYPKREVKNKTKFFDLDKPINIIFEDGNKGAWFPMGASKDRMGWGVKNDGTLVARFKYTTPEVEFAVNLGVGFDGKILDWLLHIADAQPRQIKGTDKIDFPYPWKSDQIIQFWNPVPGKTADGHDTMWIDHITKLVTGVNCER